MTRVCAPQWWQVVRQRRSLGRTKRRVVLTHWNQGLSNVNKLLREVGRTQQCCCAATCFEVESVSHLVSSWFVPFLRKR